MLTPIPLSECKQEDLVNCHALVYGRVRIWQKGLTDTSEFQWHWSNYAWWKALWYSHRGSPDRTHTWGIYGGSDGYTGPGDAELSHFLPMPPIPSGEE